MSQNLIIIIFFSPAQHTNRYRTAVQNVRMNKAGIARNAEVFNNQIATINSSFYS